jgi:hypothetical protein
MAIVSSAMCWMQIRLITRSAVKTEMIAALADAGRSTSHGPILSELPLLPILEGEGTYMLDPFSFRAIRAKEPALTEQFWKELDGRFFKAVILHGPADDPRFSSDDDDFGPGFIERMQRNYELVSRRGDFYVFVPKA